jgi:Tfp pilus assembly protein PilF
LSSAFQAALSDENVMSDQINETERQEKAISYFESAYKLQMAGQLDSAVLLYSKSIDLHPTAEAYTFRGWAYSMMGRLDEAIDECHKAIEVDPSFGNPYNDIGAYLIEKGSPEDAIPWLERAIVATRYENYHFAHLNLGRVYEAKHDLLKAMKCYSRALELEPRYSLAMKSIRRLQAKLN